MARSELTAGPNTELLSNVHDIVFEGDRYGLQHEEEKLLLDCRSVWRVQGADVVY